MSNKRDLVTSILNAQLNLTPLVTFLSVLSKTSLLMNQSPRPNLKVESKEYDSILIIIQNPFK